MAFSALLAALLLTVGTAQAAMYRWVDGNGRVHYSDTLPPSYQKNGAAEMNKQGSIIRRTQSEAERRAEAERHAKTAYPREGKRPVFRPSFRQPREPHGQYRRGRERRPERRLEGKAEIDRYAEGEQDGRPQEPAVAFGLKGRSGKTSGPDSRPHRMFPPKSPPHARARTRRRVFRYRQGWPPAPSTPNRL